MSKVNFKDIFIIICISFLSSFVLTFFFYLFPPKILEIHVPHGTNEVVERNYDGPIYVVLAKTLYNQEELQRINFNKLPFIYYANHFPLFPLIIRVTTIIIHNYFRSLILLTWIPAALFTSIFYLFIKKFKLSNKPFLLAVVSLFLPPRWLAARTVGGTEPIFMLFLIIALYLWFDKKYLLASFFAALLVLVRPPGIIFFFCFLALIIFEGMRTKNKFLYFITTVKEKWPIILMPLAILGLFYFNKYVFGNFWAFFEATKGTTPNNFSFFPFASVLGYNTTLVEGFLYLFSIYIVGIYGLWRQEKKQLAIFCLIYLLPFFFITFNYDVYRFLLPIAPFCLIIGYQKIIKHKNFKFFFLFLLIGVYVYTLSLLPNRMFHYGDYANLRSYLTE